MKKIFYSFLLLTLLLSYQNSRGQILTASVSPNVCYNPSSPSTNTCLAIVTSTATSATHYVWYSYLLPSMVQTGTYTQLSGTTGTNIAFSFPNCGSYSIVCVPFNGASPLGGAVTATVDVICPNWLSATGSAVCNGGSTTLFANQGYYATGFSWTDGTSVISTASNVVVSPTVNTCYTLTATDPYTGCSGSAVSCVTVVTTPTISLTSVASNSNHCVNTPVYLYASGATTYTWANSYGWWTQTGSTITAWPYTPTMCYTVTGQNAPGCTATAVICLTTQAGPSLTLSASPSATVCAGTPVTISAASNGISTYTWITNTTWPYPVISNTSSAVVTPVSPTWNSYTVTATDSLGCETFTHIELYVSTPVINLSGPNTICPGQTTTLSINSIGTYSWTNGITTTPGTSIVVSPTASTCYTVSGVDGITGCSATATTCLILSNSFPISISYASNNSVNPLVVCAPNGIYLNAAGASTYTWQPGNITSNSGWFYPTSNTCYTVFATSAGGCTSSAVQCVTVTTVPSITVTGNNVTCLGNPVNLSLLGSVSNYWWWTIAGTSTLSGTAFTPTATGQYTWSASGGSANGCWNSIYGTATIVPNPVVNVSGGSSICPGSSATLTASGALSYAWSNALSGSQIVVTPISTTCYNVTGTDANGCIGTATSCVNIYPVTFAAGPSSQTVCLGTSATFTSTGATTYTWSTGATLPSITVSSPSNANFTVSGTDPNGCNGTSVLSLFVDPNCSDVWAGDANSDGVVDNTDVLEIGLAFSNTGSARSPGGNAYVSQHANNWSGTVSTGKNKCHADCDGDGTVDMDDTLAIFNNFSLTHAFKPSESTTNGDINIVANQNVAYTGQWNKADILLGDVSSPINQAYGVVFDLNIDQTQLEPNSAYMVYTASFLNQNTQNVEFKKLNLANNKIHAASVRTDHADVSGSGKIAEIWYKVKSNAPENSVIAISVSNSKKINNAGTTTVLTPGTAAINVSSNGVGLKENNSLDRSVSLFPNPANKQLNLRSGMSSVVTYAIYDLLGKQISKGEFTNSKTLDVSELNAGTYIIRLQSGTLSSHKKLVIEK